MVRVQILILIALAAVGLAACSGPEAGFSEAGEPEAAAPEVDGSDPLLDSYTFLSIDEIVDTELIVSNFASDGSASLPIETSVPVACTIVYGTTPDFGSLSTDLDMDGGTHSDHNPLLIGLEPETEYFFRVQGVDDNGLVYLSEVMSFTTPVFEAETTENLASAAMGAEILGFSSAFGDAGLDERWGAGSAFDDNPNTEWSSAGDGDSAWVEVQLAQRARIEGVEFQSRSMSDGSAIALVFTVTTDSGETFGPFELPDAQDRHEFQVDIEAESLRFDLVETTGGNTGAVDIALYGSFLGE
jgi:hypothetical protein